jgi:hypothetical protein
MWLVIAVLVIVAVLGLVIRNQIKVYQRRQARADARHRPALPVQRRQVLLELLRPVSVTNCQLERFGERHDGGYLMCGNLLSAVRSAYSYGISGYDQWGCDISTKFDVPVHQYDCFDTTRTHCPEGKPVFHEECIGETRQTLDGRLFDTLANQFAKNGDGSKRVVVKMDVEGAEWLSLLFAAEDTLAQIDQLVVEFHWMRDESQWIEDERYIAVVRRLKQFFEIAHIHFNNASCVGDLQPFPSWAYEVLFVSKRLAIVDQSRTAGGLHPLDARNNPSFPDCQPTWP